MKTRVLSLMIVAMFVFSIGAFAQQNRKQGDRSKMSQERKEMLKKRFAQQRSERPDFFTAEQKESMKEMRLETAKQMKPLKNELSELMAKQNTLSTSDNVDLKAIDKNIDKMAELKAEMAKIQAKNHQEVRALLSEEQLLKFDAMKGKHKQMHRGNSRNDGMQQRHQLRRGA